MAANRKKLLWWLIPIGCLGIIGIIVAFCVFIVTFVFGLMKSSEPYKVAVEAARQDAEVTAALGSPIEPGMFPSGNISTSGSTGEANLSIPISGPNGSATIDVNATKSGGTWTYSQMQVRLDGGQVVDLSD